LLTHTVHVPEYLASWRVHGRQGTDLKQIDSSSQKRMLIKMVRYAFRQARRLDPWLTRRLRLSDLTHLYRQERLLAEFREMKRRTASRPISAWPKLCFALSWFFRDPAVFLEFLRHRHNPQRFLHSLSPLEHPRRLLKKYGLTGHLVPIPALKGTRAS
jgi:hypothetical protein